MAYLSVKRNILLTIKQLTKNLTNYCNNFIEYNQFRYENKNK